MTRRYYYSLVDPDDPHFALIGVTQHGEPFGSLYADHATAELQLHSLDNPGSLTVYEMTLPETVVWAERIIARNPNLTEFTLLSGTHSQTISLFNLRIQSKQEEIGE